MKRLLAGLSLVLLLGACETTLRADVTRFNTLSAPLTGRSFAVVADARQAGSLEFQYYAGLVGAALQDHGLLSPPAGAAPDLVVQVHYSSAGSHTEVYSEPDGGYWGWGWYGWGGWGPYPFGPEVRSTTYYAQLLQVEIFDGPAWRAGQHNMLFQGRAVGDITVNDVNIALPALVKALFKDFPGNSGQTERIRVPLSGDLQPAAGAPKAGVAA